MLLGTIASLPQDAKLAYSCQPAEEIAFWDARLLGIAAHTGRRIVPMCFQSDYLGVLTGGTLTDDLASPLFQSAPQRILYPTAGARPSTDRILAFLQSHGIDYIYADDAHPNALIPGATEVASVGNFTILRVP
jgi:hypothetical protein